MKLTIDELNKILAADDPLAMTDKQLKLSTFVRWYRQRDARGRFLPMYK